MLTKRHNLLQIPGQSGTMTPSFPLLVWPVWRRAARGRSPRGTGCPHSVWTLPPPPHRWSPGYWWSALVSRTRYLSPSQTAHPQLGSSGATIRHAEKNPQKWLFILSNHWPLKCITFFFMLKTWTLLHKKYLRAQWDAPFGPPTFA